MRKIYFIRSAKSDETGLFYDEFEISDEMETPQGYVDVAPNTELQFPTWDYQTGAWKEDLASANSYLRTQLASYLKTVDEHEKRISDLEKKE